MFLARIDGTVTATIKHRSLQGVRLLIAQRLQADGADVGEPVVVADPVGVRHRALVMVTSDGEYVRKLLKDKRAPVRLIVLGIVDAVDGAHLSKPIAMRGATLQPAAIHVGLGFGRLGFVRQAGPAKPAGAAGGGD